MSNLEEDTAPLSFIKLENESIDNHKEYLCLVFNRVTRSVETSGSDVGQDFLIKNKDVENRFKTFCGFYHGDLSMGPDDNISMVPGGDISRVPGGDISMVPVGDISLVPYVEVSVKKDLSNIDVPKHLQLEQEWDGKETNADKNNTSKEEAQEKTRNVPDFDMPTASYGKRKRGRSKYERDNEWLMGKITNNDLETKNKSGKKGRRKKTEKNTEKTSLLSDLAKVKEETVSDYEEKEDIEEDENEETDDYVDNEETDEDTEDVDDSDTDNEDTEDKLEDEKLEEKGKKRKGRKISRKTEKEKKDITANNGGKKTKKRGELFVLYNESKKCYECDICSENFPSYIDTIKHHTAEHIAKKSFPCRLCNKMLTCSSGWKKHRVMVHKQTKGSVFKCDNCQQMFVDSKGLNEHKKEFCMKIYSNKKSKKPGKLFVIFNESKKCFECDLCLASFPSHTETVKHHSTEHAAKRQYPCRYCPKVLATAEGWKSHRIMVHSQSFDSLKCEYCERLFVERQRLNKHVETCKKIYIYHCDKCDKKFSIANALESHKLSAHSSVEVQENLKCPVCEEIFGTEEARKLHEKCHEDPKNQCDVCKKWFSSAEECSKHKASHDKPVERKSKRYTCHYCKREFRYINTFQQHLELHRSTNNEREKFTCNICQKACKSARTFKEHMVQHLPNNERPYQCTICGNGYATSQSLNIHVKTHSDEKHAFCEICGKGFKDAYSIATHVRICHTGEKPYTCETCGMSFFTAGGRRDHIMVKHEAKSIICEICGKVLPSTARLSYHKLTHQTVKVECEVCKRIFNSKINYLTHYVGMHLKYEDRDNFHLKVHPCPTCKKMFLSRTRMKTHERIHTGEKPEICHVCNKGFADRNNLRAHIKSHNLKPFQCNICLKEFRQKRELHQHMGTHNTQEQNNHTHDTALDRRPWLPIWPETQSTIEDGQMEVLSSVNTILSDMPVTFQGS